jgi:hypothetical protein
MKKLLLSIGICFVSVTLSAQEIVNVFLNKHGKDESLEIVNIGKKMLDLMQSDSLAGPELREAIAGVETIRMITSKDESLRDDYYHSAYGLLSKDKEYTELVAINNEEEKLIVMVKANRGVVSELILLLNRPDFSLISLSGHIDLEMLANYSQNLDLNELKNLNIIENNN